MEKIDREVCGIFTVETEKHEVKRIIVSQPYATYYEKAKIYSKSFHLESLDGVPVHKTENADTFHLISGALLKRKKSRT